MNRKQLTLLLAVIALCESVGVIGSAFTAQSVSTWYVGLVKPSFNPPAWIFGPVWITLYAMMGVSLYLVLQKRDQVRINAAVVIFGIQLFLNLLWSPAFFGMRSPLLGLSVIVPLLVSIAATIILFYKISRTSALLLLPYLLWVSFATVLNYFIVRLN